jgi:hypothetical protein
MNTDTELAADVEAAHRAQFAPEANKLQAVRSFFETRGLHNRGQVGDCALRTAHRNAVRAAEGAQRPHTLDHFSAQDRASAAASHNHSAHGWRNANGTTPGMNCRRNSANQPWPMWPRFLMTTRTLSRSSDGRHDHENETRKEGPQLRPDNGMARPAFWCHARPLGVRWQRQRRAARQRDDHERAAV